MATIHHYKSGGTRCEACLDRSCAIAELRASELELLSNNITRNCFEPGEQLFKQDTLNAHIFYIREGLVKVHMRVTDDKDCILKIIPAPSYLGLSTIFGDSINRFSATALETTTACCIDVSTFKHLINTNGKFAYEIIADISREELRIFNRFVNRMHKQIPGRLAGALIYFAKKIYKKETLSNYLLPVSNWRSISELRGKASPDN